VLSVGVGDGVGDCVCMGVGDWVGVDVGDCVGMNVGVWFGVGMSDFVGVDLVSTVPPPILAVCFGVEFGVEVGVAVDSGVTVGVGVSIGTNGISKGSGTSMYCVTTSSIFTASALVIKLKGLNVLSGYPLTIP